MKVIGLTGGIASGKSTASAYLRELGAAIVDADAISRASTRRGGAAFEAVCAAFGDILGADGEIDRRKLGGIVFADEDARRKLNSIVHPAVMAESRAQIENARASGVKMCILDVPLLYETSMEKLCDETWLIYVPREEQIRRMEGAVGIHRKRADMADCPGDIIGRESAGKCQRNRRRCRCRRANRQPDAAGGKAQAGRCGD